METAGELSWRKSSYSTSNGGDCFEVRSASNTVAVRDSKSPSGALLAFARNNWLAFIYRLKARA